MEAQRKAYESREGRTVHVRVDPAKLDRFRAVALADHRTVSQELRHLIEQRIADADSQEQAA